MFFDISAIVFAIILIFIMKKRGGMKALLSLTGLIISIVIAIGVYPHLSQYVYNTPFPEAVEERVTSALKSQYEKIDLEKVDAMPDFFKLAAEAYTNETAQETSDTIAEAVTKVFVDVVVFVLVVLVSRVLFALLAWLLKIAVKLPVIKQFDSLVGAVCGFVMSIAVVWIASWLLCALAASSTVIQNFIQGSYTVMIMSSIAPF